MGNCCSDVDGGKAAVGGTSAAAAATLHNDAVEAFFKSRGFRGMLSQVELSFSATSLLNRDVFSKSDPMLVVYTKEREGAITEVFRTEVILNSLNPQWIMKYNVDFHFEMVQRLLFRVYDIDSQFHRVEVKTIKLEEQQLLGEACCVLSEIVANSNREVTLDIVNSQNSCSCGTLTAHAEESAPSRTTMELILRCSELANKDLFTRIDPFLVISKLVESGSKIPICKSEVVKNDQNPVWNSIFLNMQQISSKHSPLIIECYNFKSNGKHELIGKTQKSLHDLEKLSSTGEGENLYLPHAVGDENVNNILISKLYVPKFLESIQHTFMDYLRSGCQLSFMVAVDFTASNGNPRLPDSLHYIDPSGRPNAYQQAIMDVGDVLQFYDFDKQFPAWGFGARPIDGPVSHCFNLSGSISQSEVDGVHGILSAYTSALYHVSLAGPTLFGPVINAGARIAGESANKQEMKYHVLLIITDGVVTDLQETKDAIVKASDLPLSILIVGVGGADFEEMEILDADNRERLESSTGRVASRDIVQFVPLRHKQNGENSVVQELLAELPTQFLTYMRWRRVQATM